MKYRKKPIVVEAEQWDGSNLNSHESLFQHPDVLARENGPEFVVVTLEGFMRGQKGDWLIQGVNGELYPCKPDIFAATYEPAEPATAAVEVAVKCPRCGEHETVIRHSPNDLECPNCNTKWRP